MAKKKNKWLYRALCAALAVTLVSGTAVMSPIADIIGTNIVAEAVSSSQVSSSQVCHYLKGQYLDSGTTISTNVKVYTTTIYLDNSIVLNQSKADYITPSRVYVGTNSTQNNNNYIIYLTTAKLDQSPTISAESKTYDGNAVSYDTGTGYGTCTVNFTGINDTSYDSSTAPSEAGDYRMTVSYAGNGNYKSWSGTADFTISKATPVMYDGYNKWTGTGTDANGNSATVTCYWKIDNDKLYIAGTVPNTNEDWNYIPWYNQRQSIKEVYAEEGARTSADASYLFFGLYNKSTQSLSMDLSNLDTSATTNMSCMFDTCGYLKSLDLSGWNTSNVTNMKGMFYKNYQLTSLNLSGWDTSSVTDMSNMFKSCRALTSPDFSSFNTSSVTNMSHMFDDCWNLTSPNVSGWNTSSVTNMSYMFYSSDALTSLDLSGWNTSAVTNMSNMFYSSDALTSLDLSGWNTSAVTNMSKMFRQCKALTTVYVGSGWNTDTVTSYDNMFYNCTSIVGGKGTTYDENQIDVTYAHIDGGEENPGYFSAKSYTVTWMNEDGTELGTNSVANGTSPVYSGATPTKEGNAQYTYTFSGWTSDGGTTVYTTETLPAGTEDVTYTAVFESTVNTYTVTWKNDDGTILETDTDVAYGTEPTYDGATPAKPADAQCHYIFSGWKNGTNSYPADSMPEVTGDVEYTVVFTAESHSFDNGICTVCSTKEDYTIKITNGIVAKGEKEIYHVGDIVTLKADEPEEGKVFAYWKDGSGNTLSTKANYSFVVLQSVDLTAVYNNEHTAEAILNISAVQTSSNGKNAIRFVFTRSVDTKAQVEEVGLIYATNKLAGYTDGAKVNLSESDFDIETALKDNTNGKVKTYKGTSTSINGTIRLTYTIGNNTDCYVYAYGYVKLTDGTTLYTGLIATTYDSIV